MLNRNLLAPLPTTLSRWFGYRQIPPSKNPDYIIWIWSFTGVFCGLSVLQAVFEQAQYFIRRKVPTIIASYGAASVLIYGAIESPLAQLRALFCGNFLGALIGLIITKLFQLLPAEERFNELAWLAASLSVATTIVVMQMTQTTHPPGGATAILPAISKEIRDIGWYYLPIILLSSTLACAIALINNNIQRRYPVFWFTPTPPTASALVRPIIEPPSGDSTRVNSFSIETKRTESNTGSAV